MLRFFVLYMYRARESNSELVFGVQNIARQTIRFCHSRSESSGRSESCPEVFSLPLDHSPPSLEPYLKSSTSQQAAMAPKLCALCSKSRAILKRPKTGQQICKECFFYVFETEVHNTITQAQLFKPGDRVAIGASGGKGTPNILRCRVACPSFRSPW